MISGYVDLDADLVGNWANVGRTRPRNPVGWSTVRPWRPNPRTHPRRLTGLGPADGRMEWIASFRRISLSHPHCSVTANRARLLEKELKLINKNHCRMSRLSLDNFMERVLFYKMTWSEFYPKVSITVVIE